MGICPKCEQGQKPNSSSSPIKQDWVCSDCGKPVSGDLQVCPYCEGKVIKPRQKSNIKFWIGGSITIFLMFFLLVINPGRPTPPKLPIDDTPTITQSSTSTITMTPKPIVTFTLSPTNTISPSPSMTFTPTIINKVITNPRDNAIIIKIPASEFVMGSDPETDPYFWGAEGPSHHVFLDSYWIYKHEVTNKMYAECVAEEQCPKPVYDSSETRKEYFGNPDYDDYPVINVTWIGAQSYCVWAGGKLPTEAQWEKAARGDQDQRLFPWGDTPATDTQANFCDKECPIDPRDKDKYDGYRDTAPIGSYPDGVSFYGLMDTAGNVWEWVYDYFNPGYYQVSPEKNPLGPDSSRHRVIRGGGWNNPSAGVRIVQRTGLNPSLTETTVGFRCMIPDL